MTTARPADAPDTGRSGAAALEHARYGPAEWGLLLGSTAIWGASFLLIAESLVHFEPGVVTFVRTIVGAATLSLYRPSRAPIDREAWPQVVWLSVLWLAFPMTLYPIAQQHISTGLTGMLGASIPVITVLCVALVHGRLPAAVHAVGIAVGGAGIVLLGLPALGDGRDSALGVALILVGCVSYGAAFVVATPLVQRYGSAPVFWRALLVAVPLTVPYAIVGLDRSSFGLSSLAANVTLGAGGTAIAFVLLLTLTARAGATRSSMATYLEATFAFVIGTVVRSEPIRGLEVIGCAVLLVGAWLSSRAARSRIPDTR